jgi:acyl transferase domain-containing protein
MNDELRATRAPAGRLAIVSAALRFPGADSMSSYRATLARRGGQDTPVDVTSFDHERFGMSAAEASQTDVRQRLLLEVVDEALHVAAVPTAQHGGTAVFAGVGAPQMPDVDESGDVDVAERLANRLGLRGPTATVRATGATGLVAVQRACRSLLAREADVAIAAAGTVRLPAGGGVAAVVLKRLDDSMAAGDDILAVVLGSASDTTDWAPSDSPSPVALPGAAGLASLLEAVLTIGHETAPARDPGPRPDAPVHPVTTVSACGISLALEAAPALPAGPVTDRGVVLLASHRLDTLDVDTAAVRSLLAAQPAAVGDLAARSQRRAHRGGYRRHVSIDGVADLDHQFSAPNLRRATRRTPDRPSPVAFAFPGLGSEYVGMGAELARESDVFRASLARTATLAAEVGCPIDHVFVASGQAAATPAATIDLERVLRRAQTGSTGARFDGLPQAHLALFAVQLAFVDLLAHAGIRPAAVLGHSLGEWTAATVAGAVRREDAVVFVAARAALVEQAPSGATIAVADSAEAVRPLLDGAMTLAADNGPQDCTVSGPAEHAAALETRLGRADMVFQRLDTGTAFHNSQLGTAADALADRLHGARLADPVIPVVSGVTGTWLTGGRLGADYWRAQLTSPVLFRQALATVSATYRVLVEIGPGAIRPWALQTTPGIDVVRTARNSYEGVQDSDVVERALAQLWLHGHEPRWPKDPAGRPRLPVPVRPPAPRRQPLDPSRAEAT